MLVSTKNWGPRNQFIKKVNIYRRVPIFAVQLVVFSWYSYIQLAACSIKYIKLSKLYLWEYIVHFVDLIIDLLKPLRIFGLIVGCSPCLVIVRRILLLDIESQSYD